MSETVEQRAAGAPGDRSGASADGTPREAPFSLTYEVFGNEAGRDGKPIPATATTVESEPPRVVRTVFRDGSALEDIAVGRFEMPLEPQEVSEVLELVRAVRLDAMGAGRAGIPGIARIEWSYRQRARRFQAVYTTRESAMVEQAMPLTERLRELGRRSRSHPVSAVRFSLATVREDGGVRFRVRAESIGTKPALIHDFRLHPLEGEPVSARVRLTEFVDPNQPAQFEQAWRDLAFEKPDEEGSPFIELAPGETHSATTGVWTDGQAGTKYIACACIHDLHGPPVLAPEEAGGAVPVRGMARSSEHEFTF